MKQIKLLLLFTLALISSAFFIYSSTWSGTAANELVSQSALNNAVATSVFTSRTTVPTGTKMLTKGEINTYVWVNPSFSTFAGKASNQLVTKQELQSYTPVSDPATATLTIDYSSGIWTASIDNIIYSTDIKIYGHQVKGWISTTCTGGAEEGGISITLTTYDKFGSTDVVQPLEILLGQSSGTQTTNDLTCQSTRYKISTSLNINGTNRTNGSIFTIGGTTVTLNILHTSCSTYTC